VRRFLRCFLIALLTLALSMDAARACWFLRARRQCRPVAVSRPCPPPAWSRCGEVQVGEWAVSDGCCQPSACPPAPGCCAGGLAANHEPAAASDPVSVERVGEGAGRSVVQEQPTEAIGGQRPAAVAGSPAPETPAAWAADAVKPASNDEPLPDLEPVEPRETSSLLDQEPVATVADAELDVRANDLPDEAFRRDEAADAGPPLPPAADSPAAGRVDGFRRLAVEADELAVEADELVDETAEIVDETDELAVETDEMVEEAAELADEADALAGEAAEETPDDETPARRPLPPLPGIDDEPAAEEAADPAPESDPNLFEEFEEGSAAGNDVEDEMADEEADEEAGLFTDEDEPVRPAQPVIDEPADVAGGDELDAADDEPAMADDEGFTADDDEAPMADDDEGDAAEPADLPVEPEDEPLPADENDPFAEDDDSEDLAAAEPLRRWIHASGTYSLVARLRDVAGDGSCLLEADARLIRVPLENLSGHDRDYIRAAGVRLAALRDARARAAAAAATGPQATDTAGL